MEIWNGSSLEQRIILSSPYISNAQRHGKVIFDAGGFGQPSWSADETFLLYAAERNPAKTQTYFSTKPLPQEDDGTTSPSGAKQSSVKVGASFTQGIGKLEGWGEKYTKQSPLLDLYLLHTGTGRVGRIENAPSGDAAFDGDYYDDGVTIGQAVLSPTLSHVVYTAWYVATTNTMSETVKDGRRGTVQQEEDTISQPSKNYSSTHNTYVFPYDLLCTPTVSSRGIIGSP